MLNNDDVPRGTPQQPVRRAAPTRLQDNRFNSPSSTYNYNTNAGYNQNSSFNGQQQHPRRRIDRFKRETINYNDRFVRQNDSIIRLLKEIRDRLPPPPASMNPSIEPEQTILDNGVDTGAQDTNGSLADGDDSSMDNGLENDRQFDDQAEHQPE